MSTGGNTGGPVKGHALRDALARDYAANFRRLGWKVDGELLQRLAASDLATVEAHERDDRPAPPPSSGSPPVAEAPPRTSAREAIEAQGMELLRGERARIQHSPVLDAPPAMVSERYAKAVARMAEILVCQGDAAALYKRGGYDAVLAETAHPVLARAVFEVFTHYSAFLRRDSKWNPFRGLSRRDASRAFIRALEDIADRSTGAFGPWWVK